MIPDFQTLMLPLLETLRDGEEHSLRDTIDELGRRFRLTKEQRRELLQSGRQPIFDNRVGWARTYLKNAGLIEYTRRGYFRITKRGIESLKQKPDRIDIRYLDQFPGFQDFRMGTRKAESQLLPETSPDAGITPDESIEAVYQSITNSLAAEVLSQTKKVSPDFFEGLVVDLLLALGYGGSRKDAGEAIGRSGDEGLDGIIREDRLGLDIVYVQAKRWEGSVGRPEVQRFAGALMGKGARKGVMITTSSFSAEARDYARHVEGCKIVLIEGAELAQLMIEHNIGVTPVRTYEVKRIDTDYFEG